MDKILLIYAPHIDLHEEGLDVPLELIEVDETRSLHGFPLVRFRLPPGHPNIAAVGKNRDEDSMYATFCYVDVDVDVDGEAES